MSNKELFEKVAKENAIELKKLLNEKRNLEFKLKKVKFKIDLLTKDISDIRTYNLPIGSIAMNALLVCEYFNLGQIWRDATNIRISLSEHGIHEDIAEIMKTVDKLIKAVDEVHGGMDDSKST